MLRGRGFTIVELVVVMTIMAILLTLGVVSLTSSQMNARNTERQSDIEAIAKGLEARYNRDNYSATASYIMRGAYPSVNELLHAEGQAVATIYPTSTAAYLEQLLPGTRTANFFPPGTSGAVTATFQPICTAANASPCTTTAAENAAQISAVVNTTAEYVYEPIDANNQICFSAECVRYNLYYLLEGNATVQVRASSHQ